MLLQKLVGDFFDFSEGNIAGNVAWFVRKTIQNKSKETGANQNKSLAWPPLQILAVKTYFIFVQVLGGEKLLEKCR